MDGMNQELCWIARIRPRPGKSEVLREVLLGLVAPSGREPGCVAYNLHEEESEGPTTFAIYEIWRSRADHEAHMRTPHLQAFLVRLDELVEGEIAIEPLRLLAPRIPNP
jgi:quinol monooxygenase YgiN